LAGLDDDVFRRVDATGDDGGAEQEQRDVAAADAGGPAALGQRVELDAGAEVLAGVGEVAGDEGLAGVQGAGGEGPVDAVELEADALAGLGGVDLVVGDLDVLDADVHGVAVAEQDEAVLAIDDAAAHAALDDDVAGELGAVEGAVDVDERRAGGVVGGDGEVDLQSVDEVADAGGPRRGEVGEHGEGGAAEDAGAVAVVADAVEEVAGVAFDEVDPLEVLDLVAAGDEDDDLLDAEGAGEEQVLVGLRLDRVGRGDDEDDGVGEGLRARGVLEPRAVAGAVGVDEAAVLGGVADEPRDDGAG
jgi:hypothetical protein